ncbi:ExbD/TolR family protein [Nitratifractor sp.]
MSLKKFDGINVVPMIDIMLVLLVIVLTTATFIAKGVIPLELPQGKSAKEFPREQKLHISIDSRGRMFVQNAPCDVDRLRETLKARDRQTPIFLSCDKKASYERFVDVLDLLKGLGFKKINIVTVR